MNRAGTDIAPRALAALLALALASSAAALETDWEVGMREVHSDNIRRVPAADATPERQRIARLAGELRAERAGWSGMAGFSAEHWSYRDNTYSDEVRGVGRADLTWLIRPRRLTWRLEDRLAIIEEASTEPLSPDNRQQVNVFSTGPEYRIRLGGTRRLDTGVRYTDVRYSRSNTDNQRLGTQIRLGWRPGARLENQLILEVSSARFRRFPEERDYDRQDLFNRFILRRPAGRGVLDLGGTRVRRAGGEEDVVGALARLGLERQMDPHTRLRLEAGLEYSDTATDLLVRDIDRVRDPQAMESTADIFRARRSGAEFRRETPRVRLVVEARLEERDYESVALDQRRSEVGATFAMTVGARSRAEVFGSRNGYRYDVDGRRDIDRVRGLRLRYRLQRALELELEGQRTQRTSNRNAGYREDRFLLGLLYRG